MIQLDARRAPASGHSLLIDTNVWMNYFAGPDASARSEAAALFEASIRNNVSLLYTPTSLKDLFYLIPRYLRRCAATDGRGADSSRSFTTVAWSCIQTMRELADPAPLSAGECELAWMMRRMGPDLEDNLILAAAETSRVDFVVTYDQELLEKFSTACIAPSQALAAIELWGIGSR